VFQAYTASSDSALQMTASRGSARTLSRVLMISFAVVLVALVLAPWVQSASGQGRVIAYAPVERLQSIDAPVDGRIVTWHVREGSRVKSGDPIVDISDNDPLILDRLESERVALKGRIEAITQRASSIDGRIASLQLSQQSAIDAATSRVRMASERVKQSVKGLHAAEAAEVTAKKQIDRQRSLLTEGLTSTRQVELAELDHARAEIELTRMQAALRAAQSEELAIGSDLIKVKNDQAALIDDAKATLASAKAEIAGAQAELARIDVRLARQAAQRVVAPRDGVIHRLVSGTGGVQVKTGEDIAQLVPDTEDRAVELWIDGNDVPLVNLGRHVRVTFEGWPSLQFSGWPSVAVGTFGGQVALVDPADDGTGKFRLLVTPDGDEPWPPSSQLRQGARVQGWILLEQVRLGWELWRQFNGFPPTVKPAGGDGKSSGKEAKK
jgi:adhesin transport system membrane fusion protein